MSGSGPNVYPNRIIMFSEVKLPLTWHAAQDYPNPTTGFFTYVAPEAGTPFSEEPAPITITRSDGKVLSFDLKELDVIEIRDNVIRFYSPPGGSSDGPFQ